MDLILQRDLYRSDGIFGALLDVNGTPLYSTLEHAFQSEKETDKWYAALSIGTYTCERGMHRLANMIPFETFEVMKAPGHWGILFHVGNYNKDSNGCILVGSMRISTGAGLMISASKKAFATFMQIQKDLDSFQLEVRP